MNEQARKLERTLRDFERENIELFKLLKQSNAEVVKTQELERIKARESHELKLELEKWNKHASELNKTIEDQKKIIGEQSMEITELRISNKAYDISNKENAKNMNIAFERVTQMSNERK